VVWKYKGTGFCSISILIILGATFLLSGCKKDQSKDAVPPPIVEVADVIQKNVPVYSEWVASMDGLVNATIRAQVQGYLIKQNYKEGDFIKKGQILFEIDPRPFQASLGQAKASLNQAKAEVVRLEAAHFTAKANLDRVRPLADVNAVSKKDLDDAIGAELSTRAAVQASQAAVGAAEAAVEKVQLDLGFTKIVSLIDGVVGIAKAQIGNLVGPGSIEELTTVSTVDPIKVYIPESEQEYLRNRRNGQGRNRNVPLSLILADGSVHPYQGAVAFADRQVDVKTGTIRVAALFPNPGNILRPGQFARVRAQSEIKKGALLVPQRSVTELQGTFQVAVVGQDNQVDIRSVNPAERIDNLWVIDSGLKPGEKVIAEGVQKVKQGTIVNPKPYNSKPQSKTDAASRSEEKPSVQADSKKK